MVLISSGLNSGAPLETILTHLSESTYCFLSLICTSESTLISKGIRRSLTTAFIKIVKATVLLKPNWSQSESKHFLSFSSTLIVTVDCDFRITMPQIQCNLQHIYKLS